MTNTAYRDAATVDTGEPVENDATSAEMNEIAQDKLEMLGMSLARTRDRWVAARGALGVERRWMEDLEQYLGKDAASKEASSMMDAVERGGYISRDNKQKIQRSSVFVNITRPKTNAIEARLANMLYPNDDIAWGIKPTPNPVLVQQAMVEAQALADEWNKQQAPQGQAPQGPQPMATGTPMQTPGVAGGMQPAASTDAGLVSAEQTQAQSPSQLATPFRKTPAQAAIDEAYSRAKGMQAEIHDALSECDFNAEGRKVLHDVSLYGTGVMKGPIVVNRIAKVWEKLPTGAYVLNSKEQLKPASEHVSLWNIYPDPTCGDNIHNGKGIWEKKNLTGKMLRDLVGQPGYKVEQIAKVLEQGPRRMKTMNERDIRDQINYGNEPMYEGWEFWGDFDPEDLRACGVDVEDSSVKTVSGCIIMVNDIVIKGFLNPLECSSLPYDFMVLEKDDNSPWGYGVPFLCRPAQRVLNAAWRQMMDNAGLSTGANIFVKPNLVKPADGNWQITGRKIWNILDDSADASKVVHAVHFENYAEEFERIINMAMMFADEESSVPKIAQGDARQSDSVGVTTLQMNSSNVVLGRLVKQYDDMLTKPHIRRYYDFFMAYSDKDEIKGDHQVEARGSSVLLVRDMQTQSLLQFGSYQGTAVAPMVHWHKWLKEVMKSQHLNPEDLIKSDAEIEKIINQPPAPNPEQIKSQTAVEVANIKANAQLTTAQAKEQGELAFANSQAQMARDNAIMRLKELEMKRDLEILKYANEQKLSLETVKAELAKTAMVEETKRQLGAAKLQQDALESDKDRLTSQTQQGASNAQSTS